MRKIIILLIALVSFCTSAFAVNNLKTNKKNVQQETVPARDYNKEFPDEDQHNRNSVVIKAGLNLASVSSDYLEGVMDSLGFEKSHRKGVRVSVEGLRNYGLFLIGSEIAYSQKGSLYTYDDGIYTGTVETYMDYLDISMIFGLDLQVASSFHILPRLKPFFGLFLSGEILGTENGKEVQREPTIKTVGDFGVGAGIDFVIANKVVIGAFYDHGMANNLRIGEGYNRIINFSVGYNIDFTRGSINQ